MGVFQLLGTALSVLKKSKVITGIHTTSQIRDLQYTPYLYDPGHLAKLAKKAIEANDRNGLRIIKWYIEKRHEVADIGSYGKLLFNINKKIRELKDVADISDIF